jgi:hypothetical protein
MDRVKHGSREILSHFLMMQETGQENSKDFFISYNRHDRAWAEWIAQQLEQEGYSTIIQSWDFAPGQNFVSMMHEALLTIKRTLLVLSPTYLSVYASRMGGDVPEGSVRTSENGQSGGGEFPHFRPKKAPFGATYPHASLILKGSFPTFCELSRLCDESQLNRPFTK